MAAAAEEKTVKDLVLELVNKKIQELREEGAAAEGEVNTATSGRFAWSLTN